MITLVFVSVLILFLPIILPGYYVSELLISFLPYLAVISFILLAITFVYFRKKIQPGYSFPNHRYFRGISFLAFCFLFFWYSKQFNNFYDQKPSTPQIVQSWTLKVLFANIHKNNTNYEWIKKTILDNNPDMLMFVEFADHHYDNLKDFLQAKYPYTNSTARSKKFVGSMVFSKYPLINRADDFPQWMRRYGYFSVPYHNQEIYFYLIHTSSPDSYDHFIMRNNQIATWVKNFKNHESEKKHNAIVAVWDFNLTPWSPDYTLLSQSLSGELIDITKRIPFLFTRKLTIFPLLQAHIDHVWTSPSLIVENLKTIPLLGSDHKAFLFTLQL